jgi:S1-C subfamily serine protease
MEMMIKKKYSLLFIVLILVFLTGQSVSAESKINVVIDGKLLIFDSEPIIYNNSTFVPMRGIFEALGAVVEWNGATRTVTSTKGSTTVKITIDDAVALLNGSEIALTAPAMVVENRTMVPLRFVSEALGAKVEWNGSTRTVYIEQKTNLTITELAKLNSGVVLIKTFGPYGLDLGSGSGTIISPDGLIVTNYHVIDIATEALVILADNLVYPVTGVYYYSVDQDIAILKIGGINLPALTIGDSDKLELGQEIVTIGSPLGLQNSISTGIISGLNRVYENQSYIQITAPISPGNSGGALLNYRGELVGIPTWQFHLGQNLNMAIPVNEIKNVLSGSTKNQQISLADLSRELIKEVTYEEFAQFLHWEFFPLSLGDSYIDSEFVLVEDSEDQETIFLNIWLDEASFNNLREELSTNGTDNLETVLIRIGALTKISFNKPYAGRLIYLGHFSKYPDIFPEEAITVVDDTYEVVFTIVQFRDTGSGRFEWKVEN